MLTYSLLVFGGVDHDTLTGHMKAGTGYRNECQTEKLRPLTNQSSSVSLWCALSHEIAIRRSRRGFLTTSALLK